MYTSASHDTSPGPAPMGPVLLAPATEVGHGQGQQRGKDESRQHRGGFWMTPDMVLVIYHTGPSAVIV